jgi:hypothetical protein
LVSLIEPPGAGKATSKHLAAGLNPEIDGCPLPLDDLLAFLKLKTQCEKVQFCEAEITKSWVRGDASSG